MIISIDVVEAEFLLTCVVTTFTPTLGRYTRSM